MKKSTIWLLLIIMALTFIGLLYIQIMYMENMIKMRNEQFTEAVKRSLYAVSTSLELDETQRYLDEYLEEEEKKMLSSYNQQQDNQDIATHQFSIVSPDGTVASFSFREQTSTIITPAKPRLKDHNTLISTIPLSKRSVERSYPQHAQQGQQSPRIGAHRHQEAGRLPEIGI